MEKGINLGTITCIIFQIVFRCHVLSTEGVQYIENQNVWVTMV